tara:strand:- start:302 stop:484 length:183 start_codon:yes stop_codon:yes gene_type:complete
MEDLTEYNNQELSLRVFNEEPLYLDRHSLNFIDSLREIFVFNSEQLEELKTDLEEDLKKV